MSDLDLEQLLLAGTEELLFGKGEAGLDRVLSQQTSRWKTGQKLMTRRDKTQNRETRDEP